MATTTITQALIERELVAIVLLSRRLVDHPLGCLLAALDNGLDGQKAVRLPVDNGHDVGVVFFFPRKVKSSSCSATSTGISGVGKVVGKLSAYALSQLATEPWLTPAWRAACRWLFPSSTSRRACSRLASPYPFRCGSGVYFRLHTWHLITWLPATVFPFLTCLSVL